MSSMVDTIIACVTSATEEVNEEQVERDISTTLPAIAMDHLALSVALSLIDVRHPRRIDYFDIMDLLLYAIGIYDGIMLW